LGAHKNEPLGEGL